MKRAQSVNMIGPIHPISPKKNGINVLITSAGREVSLVKEFKHAVSGNGDIVGVDINSYSAAFYYCDYAYLIPRYKDSNFIPALLKICKEHRISLLIPTKDDELPIFARTKKKFEGLGARVMIASPETVEICNDKRAFAQFCQKNNFSVPRLYTIKQAMARGTRYPLFINDRQGRGSRSAFQVTTRGELRYYLGKIENPIIQEFISEKEYTIDLYADFEGRIISVVPRERIMVVGGESYIGKTVKSNILIDSAVRLARLLKLVGHNTIQVFFNGKDVKFIEVNPRFGGGANLSFAAGAHTPRYLVQMVKGENVRSRIGEFTNGLIMLRHTEDVFMEGKNIPWKKPN